MPQADLQNPHAFRVAARGQQRQIIEDQAAHFQLARLVELLVGGLQPDGLLPSRFVNEPFRILARAIIPIALHLVNQVLQRLLLLSQINHCYTSRGLDLHLRLSAYLMNLGN